MIIKFISKDELYPVYSLEDTYPWSSGKQFDISEELVERSAKVWKDWNAVQDQLEEIVKTKEQLK